MDINSNAAAKKINKEELYNRQYNMETPFNIDHIERDSLSQNIYSIGKNNQWQTWLFKFLFMYQNNYDPKFILNQEFFFVKNKKKYWLIERFKNRKYILMEFPKDKFNKNIIPKDFLRFAKNSKKLKKFDYVLIIQARIWENKNIIYMLFSINDKKLLWESKEKFLNISTLLSIVINAYTDGKKWNKNTNRLLMERYLKHKFNPNYINFSIIWTSINLKYRNQEINLPYNILSLEYITSSDKWSDNKRRKSFKKWVNLETPSINKQLKSEKKIKIIIRNKNTNNLELT